MVIVICPTLEETVREIDPRVRQVDIVHIPVSRHEREQSLSRVRDIKEPLEVARQPDERIFPVQMRLERIVYARKGISGPRTA